MDCGEDGAGVFCIKKGVVVRLVVVVLDVEVVATGSAVVSAGGGVVSACGGVVSACADVGSLAETVPAKHAKHATEKINIISTFIILFI